MSFKILVKLTMVENWINLTVYYKECEKVNSVIYTKEYFAAVNTC